MFAQPFVDQRRALRVDVHLPVLRRVDERFVPEEAVNLSMSGVALSTSSRLVPGHLENLVLSSSDGGVEVTLQAEVVRVQLAADQKFVAGLKFAFLDTASTSRIEALMLQALEQRSGQRACPRVDVHAEAFWSGPGGGSAPLEMVNVSQTGAQIRGGAVPLEHARGLLSVRSEPGAELVAVPAEIVWRKNGGSQAVAGLRFDGHSAAKDLVAQMLRSFLFVPRPAPDGVQPSTPGMRIGGFELGPLYCRGRSVTVYRARALNPAAETSGEAEVALKHFRGAPEEVAAWTNRFLASVEAGRYLYSHPGVARVYSATGDVLECWLAVELMRGSSLEEGLAELARKGVGVPIDAVLSVAREVLTTLDDCHRFIVGLDGSHLELLHGDLRASNVLINSEGVVKLAGFGAPFRRAPQTLPWLPPEVLAGELPSAQSDVYQVGVLLYEALTGVLPFRAESADQLRIAITFGAAPLSRLNREVPSSVEKLVLAALAEDPDARPPGAAAFAEALLRIEQSPQVLNAGRRRLSLVKTREITADRSIEPKTISTPPAPPVGEPPTPPVHRPLPAMALPSPPQAYQRGKPLTPWQPVRGALVAGDVIGRYTIIGKLAEGGQAEVFLARGPGSETLVLKTILPRQVEERDVVTRFINEARLASIVSHRNVAQIYDVGFDRGRPFIAMEYVEGRTLHDVLNALEQKHKKMPPRLAATVVSDCCGGLDQAHALHVVHRDVSGKNILIAYDGRVKLLDFGIARAMGSHSNTNPGKVRGTSGYVSPEQITNGPVTGSADLWALGVNLYRMLTGVMPFSGRGDFQIFNAIVESPPTPVQVLRPDAPDALCAIVERALRKKPLERYDSAASMRADADRFLDGTVGDLGLLMESLFPADQDAERARLRQLAQR